MAWYDDAVNSSGAIAGRLSSGTSLVKAAITDRINLMAQNLALLVIAFALAFGLSWQMALVGLVSFPINILYALGEHAFYQVRLNKAPQLSYQ